MRTKNLPYSTDDVKKLCHSCRICAELKPQFYRPQQNTLIKATQPMERWSIDFKGPLRSSSQNTYMLTIVDEYSCFPFAFPCPNTSSATVMKCLDKMFVLCDTPSYIHSDRGSSFLSQEIKDYFSQRGIATSKTSPYHPIGNGQCERYYLEVCAYGTENSEHVRYSMGDRTSKCTTFYQMFAFNSYKHNSP